MSKERAYYLSEADPGTYWEIFDLFCSEGMAVCAHPEYEYDHPIHVLDTSSGWEWIAPLVVETDEDG